MDWIQHSSGDMERSFNKLKLIQAPQRLNMSDSLSEDLNYADVNIFKVLT